MDKKFFKFHWFWIFIYFVIALEYLFKNEWGNVNVITWLLLASIGYELSKIRRKMKGGNKQ